MVSSSLTANTLLSLGIACICLVTIEAKALTPDLDLKELLRYSVEHSSDSLHDISQENEELSGNTPKDFMIPLISNDLTKGQRLRIKRLGIAGHENIDMILNHLQQSRPAIANRFKAPLSISGSFADLRSLMSKAGR